MIDISRQADRNGTSAKRSQVKREKGSKTSTSESYNKGEKKYAPLKI